MRNLGYTVPRYVADPTILDEWSAIRKLAETGGGRSGSDPANVTYRPGGSFPSKYESSPSKTNDSSR